MPDLSSVFHLEDGMEFRDGAGRVVVRVKIGSHMDMVLFEVLETMGWQLIHSIRKDPRFRELCKGFPLVNVKDMERRCLDIPTLEERPDDDEVGYIPIPVKDWFTDEEHVIQVRRFKGKPDGVTT